jgi:two-component system NtrC family response regulator
VIVLCDGNEITLDDLPEVLRAGAANADLIHIELPDQGLDLEAVEKELMVKALRKFDGNQTRTAAYLNISRKTLLYRLEKFGILRSEREDNPSSETADEAAKRIPFP